MELTGAYRLGRDRAAVLVALEDPAVLGRCVPFLETVRLLGPGRFQGALALKFGLFRLPVEGFAEVTETDPPEGYQIRVGRRPTGGRTVALRLREDASGGTVISYRVAVGALGPFAPFGRTWVARTAASQSGRFFDRLAAELGTRAEQMSDIGEI